MKALNLKLWRELWAMRLQAAAIALVVAGGVAMFIMSLSSFDSLYQTRERYYRDHGFADVFAGLKRAPVAVADRIRDLPGVDRVDHRVVAYVSVDIEGFDEPVSAHLVSLPVDSTGDLNRLYLRRGRLLAPGADDEVLLSQEFAAAHGLDPGDTLNATINGRREKLTVVGHALSPEYIYQIAPGAVFPDYRRYGVMWMARKPLATAYDLDGAFNHLAIQLMRGARPEALIERLDEMLGRYGGSGAIARADQLSHRFLTEDLKQQRTIATVFPLIFFSVAAFLLNVVVSRMIGLEREQIAALRAFGYGRLAIGWHYSVLVQVIVLTGSALGIAAGVWMGKGISRIFQSFYSFPYLHYVLEPGVVVAAVLIASAAGLAGTLYAVQGAARLPPAQAMRPAPPARYRPTLVERLGLGRLLSQPARIVLRQIERRPLRSALGLLGIAMACGVMMIGDFQESAIDRMIAVQYGLSQREDLLVTYVDPAPARSLHSLAALPGVLHAEGFRQVPVKLSHGHRSYRTAVQGIAPASTLLRLIDTDLQPIELPGEGVVMTDWLAGLLRISPGDLLRIEVLELDRPVIEVPLVGLSRQYMGVNAYMRQDALNRVLGEGRVVSGALLRIDADHANAINATLKDVPRIAGVVERQAAIRAFYDTLAESVLFFTMIATLLGASIAFGVVYNSLRIALSERSRELASLRVLGFTRGEVGQILLGELGVLTLLGIPLGFAVGFGLCAFLAFRFNTDLYRIPLVLGPGVYAFAALVVLVSFIVSGLMIWHSLGRLDMVAVLKSKE
ncbi:ABC transporter permease [Elongatibacter sediminis]|uniref:ABC transporter permease n=1 Tax=Elongatibacter sediminis TaxID=3119006 RepID=A0AAW9R655_9GAMM